MKRKTAFFVCVSLLLVGSSLGLASSLVKTRSLTLSETSVMELVKGSEAYSYDLQLENIALSHLAFRVAGSAGATEAADWIANQFLSFGLEVEKEEFQFTTWDLLSEPTLIIDDDGDFATTGDQKIIESFQSNHYSWPGDVFADLVVLPLPPAANRDEIGVNPIDTSAWDAIDTTGKVLLIGREVFASFGGAKAWEETYVNKLGAQTPAAIVYTWWYDWMTFIPDYPIPMRMHWDLGIAVGYVNYEHGLWIRSREAGLDVSAKFVIDSVVDVGPHYNVVGKLAGFEEPGKFVIISGHYDTVMCAGFCDNGAGTSGVIELARVFTGAARRGLYYPKFTILFVAFAAEEIGWVGSINYIMQHEAEMENIVAVINLDCIGSDSLYVAATDPTDGFDLDELILEAASDMGVNATLEATGSSDKEAFRNPTLANNIYLSFWGLTAGIDDATPVESSSWLFSYPVIFTDKWSIGTPGWIHTSYDNSTSTETLNWVEVDDLEDHIKVAALAVMRVSPSYTLVNVDLFGSASGGWGFVEDNITSPGPTIIAKEGDLVNLTLTGVDGTQHNFFVDYNGDGFPSVDEPISPDFQTTTINYQFNATISGIFTYYCQHHKGIMFGTFIVTQTGLVGDVNYDGVVDIYDVVAVSIAFGSIPLDANWNILADLNNDDVVDIFDVVTVTSNFGSTT